MTKVACKWPNCTDITQAWAVWLTWNECALCSEYCCVQGGWSEEEKCYLIFLQAVPILEGEKGQLLLLPLLLLLLLLPGQRYSVKCSGVFVQLPCRTIQGQPTSSFSISCQVPAVLLILLDRGGPLSTPHVSSSSLRRHPGLGSWDLKSMPCFSSTINHCCYTADCILKLLNIHKQLQHRHEILCWCLCLVWWELGGKETT